MSYSQTLTPAEPPNGSTNQKLFQPIICDWSGDMLPLRIYLNGQLKDSWPKGNLWFYRWQPPSIDEQYAEGSSHSWYFHYAYYADSKQWVNDHWEFGGLLWTDTPTWSFTTCTIPHADIVSPGNGATGQGLSVNLIWDKPTIGPDGNPCRCNWVDVWFSKASEPLVKVRSEYTGTALQRINLEENTTYKWRVDPHLYGWGRGTGEEWTFTTGSVPSKPTNPGPSDTATDVDIKTDNLTWDAGGDNTDTFDVYFGSDSGDLEQLASGITDESWASPYVVLEIEDFNTPVNSGYRSPEVGDVLTSGNTSYTIWNIKKGSLVGVNYEAKLFAYRDGPSLAGENGTVLTNGVTPDYNNPQAVSVTLNNSPLFKGKVESAYYPYGHTYYWRIDATNDSGTTTGDEWGFTTWALNPPLSSYILYNGLGPLEGGVEGTDWDWGGGYSLIKRLVAAAKNKIYYEDR